MTQAAAPHPIQPPDNFPVIWEYPNDGHRFWERETMHMPGQATILDDSFQRRWCDAGFNAAAEDLSLPVRNAYRRINTYIYQSIAPISHDLAELEALGREAQQRVGALLGGQVKLWNTERRPELEAMLGRWRAFDLTGSSDAALVSHLHDSIAWSERAWHIHFLTVVPVLMSMSLFDDFYGELFGRDDIYASYRLLQGLDNHSLQADRELYALSRRILDFPSVREVFETAAATDVMPKLATFPEGRVVLAELNAFLAEHGRRTTLYINVSAPSWIEDPAPLITVLQDAITRPARDPLADLQALATERDRLTDEARARLAGYPESVRGQFEFLLDAARQGAVMQEDHNYWIDTQVVYEVRRVVLAVGARLVRNGAVDAADDVFHLRLDELNDLSGDRRALIASRKKELEQFQHVPSPPVLGTLPPGPPPDDPLTRSLFKMFGGIPRESTNPGEIFGMAGSPGVVRARVRLVHSLGEGDALQHGEVLVAPTTAPPWTPLFARAAAIVTDTGGILSHCAIVAREYKIPAVVGTKRATGVLKNGQLVEVDGTAGSVRIVEG